MPHDKFCRCSMCADESDISFTPGDWRADKPKAKDDSDFWASTGQPVRDSEDLQRILDLPRRQPVDPDSVTGQAIVELEMQRYGVENNACECRKIDPTRFVNNRGTCIKKFLPLQAIMLRELRTAKGLLASAAVGGGKTLVGLLAACALDVARALMFIPASLVDQIEIDYKLAAQHFKVPSIVVHRAGGSEFRRLVPGMPILHVMPYSLISDKKMSAWIDNLAPDAIIADECDAFSALTSARTMRLMRFFAGTKEMTKEQRLKRARTFFCGWTGSLTDSKLSEFAHLLAIALKFGSPLPLDPDEVEEWGRFANATDSPCPSGALIKLCGPGEHSEDDVHEALHRRLVETVGFLAISGAPIISASGVEVQNEIRERKVLEIPDIVKLALEMARDSRRPDTLAGADEDEWLVDPLEQARVVRQVATGMFYRWVYPRGEKRELIRRWLEARKNWNRELRQKMLRGQVHLDSQSLCEAAAMRAWGQLPPDKNLPTWKAESWPAWFEVMDLVKPKTEAVRLHPFLVEDSANWALEKPGIVWYTMTEFAEWLVELTGLPLHEGGKDAGKKIMREDGKRSIIASVGSHGRGRDRMQFVFHRQLIAQIMASDRRYQQLFGRLDRRGQPMDKVETDVYLHTPEIRKSFDQALMKGKYVYRYIKEKRKLLEGWAGRDEEPGK